MKFVDDRTPEQHATHTVVVWGKDTFLSRWGEGKKGPSLAGWACQPEDESRCLAWVRNRSDMKNVRVARARRLKPPSGPGHFHIYVFEP